MQCPTELMVADQHVFPAPTRLLCVEWICSVSAWINTYVTMFQLWGVALNFTFLFIYTACGIQMSQNVVIVS